MPITTQDEFLQKILNSVDGKPRTVLDISRRAGVSWQAAKRALETLNKVGAVKSRRVGERTLYYRVKESNDTWFGIPIDDEQRKVLEYIYERASSLYKERTGKSLGRTQAQKIAVRVIRRAGLNIPTPRYLYGRITLLTFEKQPETDTIEEKLARQLDPHIEKSVEWAVDKGGKLIALAQYEEEDNKLYRVLMEIDESINRVIQGQQPPRNIHDLLMDLLAYAPDDDVIIEAIKELISHLWLLREGMEGALTFRDLFETVRRIIALHLMYEDLRQAGYDDEDLRGLLHTKRSTIAEFQHLLSEIEEPAPDENTREVLRKIREAGEDTEGWKEKGLKILRELGAN